MHLPRREFISAALTTSAVAALGTVAASGAETPASAPSAGREFYELRAYRLNAGAPDHGLLDAYLREALIPALNARGIKAVGVFTEPEAKDGPAVWVLIPHPSFESVAHVTASLNADPGVLAAAGRYLTEPTRDKPAFARLDIWLLHAFEDLPRHEIPARDGGPLVFELRVYESFSEAKGRKKVDMFNNGEIDLFRELGFMPVFFGEAIAGSNLPHLAYIMASRDRATHDAAWKAFFVHPKWEKLKNDPQYADTVSKVVSRYLVPTAFSQF